VRAWRRESSRKPGRMWLPWEKDYEEVGADSGKPGEDEGEEY